MIDSASEHLKMNANVEDAETERKYGVVVGLHDRATLLSQSHETSVHHMCSGVEEGPNKRDASGVNQHLSVSEDTQEEVFDLDVIQQTKLIRCGTFPATVPKRQPDDLPRP